MSDAIETQGFKLEIGPSGESPGGLTEIKEIIDFTAFDGEAAEIATTNLQSTAKEFLIGLQDFGGLAISVNHLPADAGQVEARAAKASRVQKAFLITFTDASTASFEGFVKSNPLTGGVDAVVAGSFSIRITGDVTFA